MKDRTFYVIQFSNDDIYITRECAGSSVYLLDDRSTICRRDTSMREHFAVRFKTVDSAVAIAKRFIRKHPDYNNRLSIIKVIPDVEYKNKKWYETYYNKTYLHSVNGCIKYISPFNTDEINELMFWNASNREYARKVNPGTIITLGNLTKKLGNSKLVCTHSNYFNFQSFYDMRPIVLRCRVEHLEEGNISNDAVAFIYTTGNLGEIKRTIKCIIVNKDDIDAYQMANELMHERRWNIENMK